jgi:hypothetical protein
VVAEKDNIKGPVGINIVYCVWRNGGKISSSYDGRAARVTCLSATRQPGVDHVGCWDFLRGGPLAALYCCPELIKFDSGADTGGWISVWRDAVRRRTVCVIWDAGMVVGIE